jgi:pyridoxal biosynthesis lyase PdxS
MAIVFVPGQVAVGDPAAGTGPSATSNIKDVLTKVIKLTSANFSTGGVNTQVAVLPADATILNMRLWVKTQLAGGGITAATYSVGSASAGTQFVNAITAFATAGTNVIVSPLTGIMQNYNIPYGTDIQVWVNGTATTGTPTSGELYLTLEYTR